MTYQSRDPHPRPDHHPEITTGAPIVQVRLVRDVERAYEPRTQLRSPEDVATLLRSLFQDSPVEEMYAVMLNTANVIINVCRISTGGLASAVVEPRGVFQAAILANAACIILAHNHPSENPEPSREDIRLTRQLVEAGKLLGIHVHDHVIFAGKGYTSFAERGLMPS